MSAYLVNKKLRKKDESNLKAGIIDESLPVPVQTFILRGHYPESYLNFVKKEEWFIAVKSKMTKLGMVKDKTLKSKAERKASFHINSVKLVKSIIEELESNFS